MDVVPFVHEGLGNSSYLVGYGEGRAIVVDPDRSVERYLAAANARRWRIHAVLETHLHADFVSGARELLAHDVRLFLPAGAASRLPHHAVRPGDDITLDGLAAAAVASPGHTPEHLSYVLREASAPPALFSGGSLIVGGAARTDLIAPGQTEALTRAQFHTLRHAFSALPDATPLYPTHGGGSYCSAGGEGGRTSTLGAERASNPALAVTDEQEFVRWFPSTFPAAPDYFFRLRAFNQAGPRLRADIAMPPALSTASFAAASGSAGAGLVLDTRSVEDYSAAHIPGALHIAFRDSFGVWVGWLVPPEAPLLFVAEASSLDDVLAECLLVGYERFAGWLEGGIDAWRAAGRPIASVDLAAPAAARELVDAGSAVVDVREPDELAVGAVPGSRNLPLGRLPATLHDSAPASGGPVVVYCSRGERASTAASILERAGHDRIVNVRGGYAALQQQTTTDDLATES
jgi:glyoxylase-like metal-dependent hydrolase (beta-lactamase superfamily II)/rhodanese-related sulfurtransferase